jgi:hypothetical protein
MSEWPDGEPKPTKFILTSLPRRMSKKQIVRIGSAAMPRCGVPSSVGQPTTSRLFDAARALLAMLRIPMPITKPLRSTIARARLSEMNACVKSSGLAQSDDPSRHSAARRELAPSANCTKRFRAGSTSFDM